MNNFTEKQIKIQHPLFDRFFCANILSLQDWRKLIYNQKEWRRKDSLFSAYETYRPTARFSGRERKSSDRISVKKVEINFHDAGNQSDFKNVSSKFGEEKE